MGRSGDEIQTAYGISPRSVEHPVLRDWVTAGWLLALDAQMIRLAAPLQVLYEIVGTIEGSRQQMSTAPLPETRFKAALQRLGNALTDDSERITQDAVSGTILTIIWKHLAHLAYNVGLSPKKLRYGRKINGVELTQVLWAVRGAEMHGMSWAFRNFKIDKEGREQIGVLKTAGINPIPFRASEALSLVAPDGIVVLMNEMIPIIHAMVGDAITVEEETKTRVSRKKVEKARKKSVPKRRTLKK